MSVRSPKTAAANLDLADPKNDLDDIHELSSTETNELQKTDAA